MITTSTRLALGYTAMLVHGVAHAGRLGNAGVRASLLRQVQLSGVQALPVVALLAAVLGAVVPTQALALLGVDNEAVLKTVVWGGLRELAPLVTALVLIARSAVAMAAEIALMHLRSSLSDAQWADAAHEEEVVLPRVLGLAVAGALGVSYFQAVSIAAALLASALLLGTPLDTELDYFLANGAWWQVPLSIGKGALFGAGIGVVACYHGLQAAPQVAAVPKAAVAACIGSLVFVALADGLAVGLRWL